MDDAKFIYEAFSNDYEYLVVANNIGHVRKLVDDELTVIRKLGVVTADRHILTNVGVRFKMEKELGHISEK